MENLKKKYGLMTGIAMVVGIVIGSGVFFKAPKVLLSTDGKLSLSLLAWFIGGAIMVISAYCFSLVATKIEKVNGAVDYVEAATNKKVGYLTGWYFTTIYYPILVSILAFVSMNYFYTLCGFSGAVVSVVFWIATAGLVALSFVLNIIAPKLAGYWQVSTTIIKMIPIFIVAVIGTIIGLVNGNTVEAFKSFADVARFEELNITVTNDFGTAILATIFAYEGWIVATSINAELKDSKRNLPLALVLGTFIVIVAYLLYYIGLSSLIPDTNDIMEAGNNAPLIAIGNIMGTFGQSLFNVLIVVSCLGTLNGLTMGCSRGAYSLAIRGQGGNPEDYSKLNSKTNTSIRSGIFGFVLSIFFLIIWLLSFLTQFTFLESMDELSIAFVYATYIFVYLWIMKTRNDLNKFNRFIMPGLAILCAVFLVFAATGLFTWVNSGYEDYSKIESFAVFAIISGGILAIGALNYRANPKPVEQFK